VEYSPLDVVGVTLEVAVVGVKEPESEVLRGLVAGMGWANGRPSGPSGSVGSMEVQVWVVESVAEVLSMLAEGVPAWPGKTRDGIEGAGKISSVYMSSRIFDRPTMAEGWSAKWFSADSKCASAT
jgi:hypothetical protein